MLLILVILPLFSISAEDICGYKPQATVSIKNSQGIERSFEVGIADTPAKYERGLMHCKELKKGSGLFFIFNQDRLQYFWMKNTLIPLAIIYIDKNFEVVSVGRGVPLSTKMVPSFKPARYVLEVNWEEGKDVKPGDKAVFKMK